MRQSLLGTLLSFPLLVVSLSGCQSPPSAPPAGTTPPGPTTPARAASLARAPFGALPDGTALELFTLTNATGTRVRVTNYGGIIVSLDTADRAGALGDIVLGYDTIDGYLKATPYFGAIVGRYGNRIAQGPLHARRQGRTRSPPTTAPNHLHGGRKGFDKVVWDADAVRTGQAQSGVVLTYTSADGEEGYPGHARRDGDLHADRRRTSCGSTTRRRPTSRRR